MGIREVDKVRAGGSLAVSLGKLRIEDHLAREAQRGAVVSSPDWSCELPLGDVVVVEEGRGYRPHSDAHRRTP